VASTRARFYCRLWTDSISFICRRDDNVVQRGNWLSHEGDFRPADRRKVKCTF